MTVNGRTVTKLSATLQRRYKDKNEQWKISNSSGRNEIPLAIYCREKAFAAMIEERQASEEEVL